MPNLPGAARAIALSSLLSSASIGLLACRTAEPTSAAPPADTRAATAIPAGTAGSRAQSPIASAAPSPTAGIDKGLTEVPVPQAATVRPIGPSPAAIPDALPCTRDNECVITTYAGCCACCPAAPYATRHDELDKARQVCTRVRCAGCGTVDCSTGDEESGYRAVCKEKKCTAVKK